MGNRAAISCLWKNCILQLVNTKLEHTARAEMEEVAANEQTVLIAFCQGWQPQANEYPIWMGKIYTSYLTFKNRASYIQDGRTATL